MFNLQINENELKTYINSLVENAIRENNCSSKKTWLNLSEVCDEFRLPKNSVKDKRWRDKNKFPYFQIEGVYGNIIYNYNDVENWLKTKKTQKC